MTEELGVSSKNFSNWITLSANLAVLVGIVLVLLELNQNSDLMRAQITQVRADNLIASMESRMHSEHWPRISAKLREAATESQTHRGDVIYTTELLKILDPVERERVFYFYLREINDLRAQYIQMQQGYLPEVVWNTSSRGQVIRTMTLAAAFNRPCNRDEEFRNELNRIAAEEGIPQCSGESAWR